MSIKISEVFNGLVSQQLPAIMTILGKAKDTAAANGIDEKSLLDARLHADMHPLSWQLQTTLELLLRGATRLAGAEPASLELNEISFSALIKRVEEIQAELSNLDEDAINKNAETIISIPIGPEATLDLTGNDYVTKFLLPNFYFHLTTFYALLRMNDVPLGKRDYIGPIL